MIERHLAEHRKLYGDFEVVDFVDTDEIARLRNQTKSDVAVEVNWTWDYDSKIAELRNLYEKGKVNQWNAETDIDWEMPVSKDEWVIARDRSIMGSACEMLGYDEATQKAAAFDELSYMLSQLLHGEQAALELCGQLTNVCEDIDQKSYAASQVIDEARHIEAISKFLSRKMGQIYPISPTLKYLLEELLRAEGVQKKTLGMQTLFEGAAVGIMDEFRRHSACDLLNVLLKRVEQDEARHAAFGVICMRNVVKTAEPEEMEEMEDWAFGILETLQASIGMEMLRTIGPKYGMNADDFIEGMLADERYQQLSAGLYMHTVVPNLRRLGLITERTEERWHQAGLIWTPPASDEALAS